MSEHTPATGTRSRAQLMLTGVVLMLVSIAAWLCGDEPIDDRGSDSTEKSFMIILAISIGGAVSAAAIAFIATKTSLFK